MKKKPARDLSCFVRHNNGALQNIKRENERQDYIKKLLNDASDEDWYY